MTLNFYFLVFILIITLFLFLFFLVDNGEGLMIFYCCTSCNGKRVVISFFINMVEAFNNCVLNFSFNKKNSTSKFVYLLFFWFYFLVIIVIPPAILLLCWSIEHPENTLDFKICIPKIKINFYILLKNYELIPGLIY